MGKEDSEDMWNVMGNEHRVSGQKDGQIEGIIAKSVSSFLDIYRAQISMQFLLGFPPTKKP